MCHNMCICVHVVLQKVCQLYYIHYIHVIIESIISTEEEKKKVYVLHYH